MKIRRFHGNKITGNENKEVSDGNKITDNENKEVSDGNKITGNENKEVSDGNKITDNENKEVSDGNKLYFILSNLLPKIPQKCLVVHPAFGQIHFPRL